MFETLISRRFFFFAKISRAASEKRGAMITSVKTSLISLDAAVPDDGMALRDLFGGHVAHEEDPRGVATLIEEAANDRNQPAAPRRPERARNGGAFPFA